MAERDEDGGVVAAEDNPKAADDGPGVPGVRAVFGPGAFGFLESIANHPAVFPAVSRKGQARIVLTGEDCIGLECEDGGWVVQRLHQGLWECHTLFLPGAKDVRAKAREAIAYMFTATDCTEIVTKVPRDLPAALGLAKAVGFKHRYECAHGWERESGFVAVDYLSIRIEDWIISGACAEAGHKFHEQMVAGGFEVNHPEDVVHDSHAGFVVECGKRGLTDKGAWFYNRWALLAGYVPLIVRGDSVQFNDVVASMKDDRIILERVQCL